jgi:hypothetical protein
MSEGAAATEARRQLDVFVGRWEIRAGDSSGDASAGAASFEWALDDRFLIWRTSLPDPKFPEGLAVIAVNPDGAYTQHYFDSNGNARLYKMTLDAGVWTLLRDEPDFTPLELSQRFSGSIAPGGEAINGAWESSGTDGAWQKDFDLVYRRLSPGR